MSRTVTTTDTQEKIPDTERLEKIYNFLADEDVHRNFGFWEHLDNIEEHLLGLFRKYFSPRAKSDKDEDGNFTYKDPDFEFVEWEKAMAMVKEHRKWMGKDYAPRKPFNTDSIAPLRQERYLLLTSEAIRPPTGQVIIAAPVSPTNPAIPKEVPLHLALPPEDPARKRLTDPLHYTKKAAQIRRLKEYASKNTEEKSIRHIAVHLPAPKNFHGPYVTPISNEQAPLAIAERVARVDSLIRALKEAQKKAPRRLLEKVIGRIEQGENVTEFGSKRLIDDFVEDWIQWTTSAEAVTPMREEEWKLLTILTEPSAEICGRKPSDPGASITRHPEDRFHDVEVPMIDGLPTIVRYNGSGEIGPQIKMDSWAVFQRLGYRLGAEKSSLSRDPILNPPAAVNPLVPDTKREDELVDTAEAAAVDELYDLTTNRFPELDMDAIVPELAPGQLFDEWTDSNKSQLIRDKIINESLRADNDRTLDHSKLWAFALNKDVHYLEANDMDLDEEPPKQFFSMSRWPAEIMSWEARLDMEEDAPIRDRGDEEAVKMTPEEMAAMEKAHVAAYFATPPRERFIKGMAHYPFGETRTQEIILSRQIADDLEGVEGYDFKPKKKLGLFSVLNPANWWRKRKATDDGNTDPAKRQAVAEEENDENDENAMVWDDE